ncbi:hypothetical protein B296_00029775 [Ensete ventricosum]|uniref:Uncharacterized protein n=1 Tax=Ensete ventricosum TaxID=4639 RepID=A0A427AK83_ENSVE|nr:hypothetical protein B296_00029775 [Ensete ventricosum]
MASVPISTPLGFAATVSSSARSRSLKPAPPRQLESASSKPWTGLISNRTEMSASELSAPASSRYKWLVGPCSRSYSL